MKAVLVLGVAALSYIGVASANCRLASVTNAKHAICLGNATLPLRDGEYTFQHKYAEAEQHRIRSIDLLVEIRGNSIVVMNNDCSDVFPIGVLEEGTLIWHSKSGQWIIGAKPSDRDADEVGGCTDGPTVIDLQNRIYWTC